MGSLSCGPTNAAMLREQPRNRGQKASTYINFYPIVPLNICFSPIVLQLMLGFIFSRCSDSLLLSFCNKNEC